MAKVREVISAGADGESRTVLARFTLEDDGSVRAEYGYEGAEKIFAAGIWSVPERRKVKLAEGRLFFDALPKCWGASSRVWTRDDE
jgi:hypothetical protein